MGELSAQALGTGARARERLIPSQPAIGALAPVVIPAVVGCHIALLKGCSINVILGLNPGAGFRIRFAHGVVDQPAQLAVRVRVGVVFVVVVGKGLSHWVHAAVAANAVIKEYSAVTARAAGDILANPVWWQSNVCNLLQVVAHVIDQGETEHGPVGAGTEERPGRSP